MANSEADLAKFAQLVRDLGLQTAVVDYDFRVDSSGELPNEEVIIDGVPWPAANGVSSRVADRRKWPYDRKGNPWLSPEEQLDDWHAPIIDLDYNCALIESRTPGHHHLILGRYVSRSAYIEILAVLAKHGLVQEGYAVAAEKRGATWLRTPHYADIDVEDAKGDVAQAKAERELEEGPIF